MGIWRKATIISIGLSILSAVIDGNTDDSTATTVAELALLAKVIGGEVTPAQPGIANADKPDRPASDLAAILGQ